MKIIYSEYPAEYKHYYFPYHIWAIEEELTDRDTLLAQGFLPTRFKIGLWYLARSCRINLAQFNPSSENRRIFKQTESIICTFKENDAPILTPDTLSLIRAYLDESIPVDFSDAAITRIFSKQLTQIVETYGEKDEIIGLSPIMKTASSIFYWYGFYRPEYQKRGIGMRAMLEATSWAKHEQLDYAYLGTAYTDSSLYKTNIPGFEFFNGFEWSADTDELKYLISKDKSDSKDDLLLDTEFQERFYHAPNLTKFLNRYA